MIPFAEIWRVQGAFGQRGALRESSRAGVRAGASGMVLAIGQGALSKCYAVDRLGGSKIARLWMIPCIFWQPRFCASFISDAGVPAARRNLRRKSCTRSSQLSPDICIRSKIGASSHGIAPRLSARNCRPVQSSNCRYSLNGICRQPLFEARHVGADWSTVVCDNSNGLSQSARAEAVRCGTRLWLARSSVP